MISPRELLKPVSLLVLSIGLLTGCDSRPEVEASSDMAASVAWQKPADPKASDYLAGCEADHGRIRTQMEAFADESKRYQPQELLEAINNIDLLLDKQMNLASLYANVHPNEAVRLSAEECEQKFVELISEISLSRPLYNHLVAVDKASLDTQGKRLVEHLLRDFKRAGVDKDEATRARIKKLNEEINLIGQNFDKNIRDGARQLVLNSVDDLKGLPQDYIDTHKPNEEGKIILTTAYPDYVPFMQYAESDELRKKFYVIFRQQAYPENKAVLQSLIEKRHELAQILGYENFSAFITEDKMIGSPAKVQSFIDKVSAVATPRAEQEYQQLLTRLQQIDPSATRVEDWQKMYVEHLVKKEDYQVNAQEVRQYFHYDKVKQGIFELVQAMFGVSIRPWQTDVWHESVNAYEILEGEKVIGRFYLDMHPRTGKYKHAAAFSVVNGIEGVQLPVAALVCNFPGDDGSSGLMEHADVETFLHEFGHLLHGIFAGTNQRWMYFSGIKTEWDFVEAPSQMLEEWVWDTETLASFAQNDKGEVIPPELVAKMIAARDFGRGMWTKHQLFYAALSLGLYNTDPAKLDLNKVMEDIQSTYSPFGYVDDTYFYASFGHLNGYSSIYYTYMWSLVIAADMHSEFMKKGLRNPELSHHFRKTVLEPGGAKDAAELVEDFLGRPYSFDAFANDLSVK
uniref:M3 family metallopeptidase n=1 Tax=Cellvibrio fontiphilus TaxID=1815559 RepID=UPI002B4BDDA1|nr:M3 family metallopeptidase [Cellvibrio fontiphilus]